MVKDLKSKKMPMTKRNPIALNPLMKKSHVHAKDIKTERSKNKRSLKKALHEGDAADQ